MSPLVAQPKYSLAPIEEHFVSYALLFSHGCRTDTPDLMAAFSNAQEQALLAEGYVVAGDLDAQMAEEDMPSSADALPPE